MTKKVLFKTISDATPLFNIALSYLIQCKVRIAVSKFVPTEKERITFLLDFFMRLQDIRERQNISEVYDYLYNILNSYESVQKICLDNNIMASRYMSAIISVQLTEFIHSISTYKFTRVHLKKVIREL